MISFQMPLSDVVRAAWVVDVEREPNGCALAGHGLHDRLSSEQPRALRHALQSETALPRSRSNTCHRGRRRWRRSRESLPVVFDGNRHRPRVTRVASVK
jgi:hypothetical protein